MEDLLTSIDDDTRQQILDEDNLRLLRIGYFISAGLTAVGALFILVYMLFFSFMFTQIAKGPGDIAFASLMGRLIAVFGVLLVIFVGGIAVLQFLTGQRLKERRSRTFCMVIAGLTCLSIPWGTFLGVCTFLVLLRPTVQRSFEEVRP
jgi:hypothetical protein